MDKGLWDRGRGKRAIDKGQWIRGCGKGSFLPPYKAFPRIYYIMLVFGSNGMLGRYVSKYLGTTGLTRSNYDPLTHTFIDLEQLIKKHNPKVIINCIGIIPQRGTNNAREMFIVNTLFPQQLSEICYRMKINFIHITTDCVFDGKTGNYNEISAHTETNTYGLSKSLGEPLLPYTCIIRTSIIGEEVNNKKSLLEWVKSNKGGVINGYVNHYWNGVTCLELAKYIGDVIKRGTFWVGVRHVYSPAIYSKYELVNYINEIWDLGIMVEKYYTDTVNKSLVSIYEGGEVGIGIYEQLLELKKNNFF